MPLKQFLRFVTPLLFLCALIVYFVSIPHGSTTGVNRSGEQGAVTGGIAPGVERLGGEAKATLQIESAPAAQPARSSVRTDLIPPLSSISLAVGYFSLDGWKPLSNAQVILADGTTALTDANGTPPVTRPLSEVVSVSHPAFVSWSQGDATDAPRQITLTPLLAKCVLIPPEGTSISGAPKIFGFVPAQESLRPVPVASKCLTATEFELTGLDPFVDYTLVAALGGIYGTTVRPGLRSLPNHDAPPASVDLQVAFLYGCCVSFKVRDGVERNSVLPVWVGANSLTVGPELRNLLVNNRPIDREFLAHMGWDQFSARAIRIICTSASPTPSRLDFSWSVEYPEFHALKSVSTLAPICDTLRVEVMDVERRDVAHQIPVLTLRRGRDLILENPERLIVHASLGKSRLWVSVPQGARLPMRLGPVPAEVNVSWALSWPTRNVSIPVVASQSTDVPEAQEGELPLEFDLAVLDAVGTGTVHIKFVGLHGEAVSLPLVMMSLEPIEVRAKSGVTEAAPPGVTGHPSVSAIVSDPLLAGEYKLTLRAPTLEHRTQVQVRPGESTELTVTVGK